MKFIIFHQVILTYYTLQILKHMRKNIKLSKKCRRTIYSHNISSFGRLLLFLLLLHLTVHYKRLRGSRGLCGLQVPGGVLTRWCGGYRSRSTARSVGYTNSRGRCCTYRTRSGRHWRITMFKWSWLANCAACCVHCSVRYNLMRYWTPILNVLLQ